MDIKNSTGSTDTDFNSDPGNYPLLSNMSTTDDPTGSNVIPTPDYPLLPVIIKKSYDKISLNKMFLYTGEFFEPINYFKEYINNPQQDTKDFLLHIYTERINSGIDIVQDYKTVESIILPPEFANIFTLIGDNKNLLNSLYCLAYIYNMHFSVPEGINTLFLNPFFFPFHRAFILSDGIHDLEPRCNMTAKFWSKLFNTKNYRNKEDLRAAIFNTAVKPSKNWCDNTAQEYIDKWNDLSAKSGHHFIEPNNHEERRIGNVIIPMIEEFSDITKVPDLVKNDKTIFRVGDSSKLKEYEETAEEKIARKLREKAKKKMTKKKSSDEEEEEDENGGGGKFNKDFAERFKENYDFVDENTFAVSDCPGPNAEQYKLILKNQQSPVRVTSIVSGTLDSSSASNIGLTAHLTNILNDYLKYNKPLSIFLPEASFLNPNNTITEVMQRITIDINRDFNMRFEKWSGPSEFHCPIENLLQSNPVPIYDSDKCPGVNETIQYIFSKLGVKNSDLLKSGACCLFGFFGGGEKLNADAETNDFLDKYYEAFQKIGIPDKMEEMGGCLFRVKTMGDFYRLSDTALIQYILNAQGGGGKALLGTCDEYNAINSFASNNLFTIYGAPPHHRFQWYGPLQNVSPEELVRRDLEKDMKKFIKNLKEMFRLHKELKYYNSKFSISKPDSKIMKTIKHVSEFVKSDLNKLVKDSIENTDTYNETIKTQIIDNETIKTEFEKTRNETKYKKTLDDNKSMFSSVIDSLKINAKNKVYVLLTLLYVDDLLRKMKEQMNVYFGPSNEYIKLIDDYITLPDKDLEDMYETTKSNGTLDQQKRSCDNYIKIYTPIVKLLERLNNPANAITETIKPDMFDNKPDTIMIGYDSYMNMNNIPNTKRLYQNTVTLSKNKKTPFDQLASQLCAIVDVDNTNFLTLLETAYSLDKLADKELSLKLISELKISDLYVPVITNHDPVILTNIYTLITQLKPAAIVISGVNNSNMSAGKKTTMSGGNLLTPDISTVLINTLINQICSLMGINVPEPTTMTMESFITTIEDDIESEKIDYVNYYSNKRTIALRYIDLIDLIEYILNDNTIEQSNRGKYIDFINTLNKYFLIINNHVILEEFKKIFSDLEFISDHYNLKPSENHQTKIRIIPFLKADFYSKFLDFYNYGIFVKDNNISTMQTYFYVDITSGQVKMVHIPNDETMIETLYNNIIGESKDTKLIPEDIQTIPYYHQIIDKVKQDYAYLNFIENPMLNTFLMAIYLNNYNVDMDIDLYLPQTEPSSIHNVPSTLSGYSQEEYNDLTSRYVRQLELLNTRQPVSVEPVSVESINELEKQIKRKEFSIRRRRSNTGINDLPPKEIIKKRLEINSLKRKLNKLRELQKESSDKPLPVHITFNPRLSKITEEKERPFSKPVSNDPRIRTLSHTDTDTQNEPGVNYIEIGSNKRLRTTNAVSKVGGKRIRTRKYITKKKKRTRKLNKRLNKRLTKHKKLRVNKYTRRR